MKKIKILKDTKTNYNLLKRKKNDITFYCFDDFYENSYYLSFHKQNMNICIYNINNVEMFEKIFFKLLNFEYEFFRKGIYFEKTQFNEIVFLYKKPKEILEKYNNFKSFQRRLDFDFNPKNYL